MDPLPANDGDNGPQVARLVIGLVAVLALAACASLVLYLKA